MVDLKLSDDVDEAMSDEILLSIVLAVVVLLVLLTWLVSIKFLWGFLALWLVYVSYLLGYQVKKNRNRP
jgi:membrane protein required for beta-lactamase induction